MGGGGELRGEVLSYIVDAINLRRVELDVVAPSAWLVNASEQRSANKGGKENVHKQLFTTCVRKRLS